WQPSIEKKMHRYATSTIVAISVAAVIGSEGNITIRLSTSFMGNHLMGVMPGVAVVECGVLMYGLWLEFEYKGHKVKLQITGVHFDYLTCLSHSTAHMPETCIHPMLMSGVVFPQITSEDVQ
ncbi:hypothetical protein ACJX0J_006677, partial [Zea mays]